MASRHEGPRNRTTDQLSVALVYEPVVGALAERVAAGLDDAHALLLTGPIESVSPGAAAAADLLVVGCLATALHSMRPAIPAPRRSPDEAGCRSLREWLAAVPTQRRRTPGSSPAYIAAFDARLTRSGRKNLSASCQTARVLTRRGFELAVRPVSFLLDGLTDDPAYGECGRAEHWGRDTADLTLARLHGDPAGWWTHPSGTDHSTTVPAASPGATRH